jgi:hypothetical protein
MSIREVADPGSLLDNPGRRPNFSPENQGLLIPPEA